MKRIAVVLTALLAATLVRGKVRPAKPGRIARLFQITDCVDPIERCPAPVLLAKATIAEDGSYRLVRRFKVPGKRIPYVAVPGGFRNLAGASTYRYIRVG